MGQPAHAEEGEYSEQVYLSEAQALKQVFGDLQIETQILKPTAAQRKALQKHLRRKLEEPQYTLYVGKKAGKILRYALILDEKDMHYPITFIVAMTPTASVDQVAVMVYRERRGDGVRTSLGHQVGEHVTRAGGRLEAAVTPAAVEIEPVDIGLVDDG